MFMGWMSDQPFARVVGSCMVRVGSNSGGPCIYDTFEDHEQSKKPLSYSPWDESIYFWYNRRLLRFQFIPRKTSPDQDISISCIGGSPTILRDFFDECRRRYLRQTEKKTSIFEPHSDDWKKTKAKENRQVDTVIMDEEVKQDSIEDVKNFLDPKSRAWYTERGLPYRRGLLLYGPPGTGKSSFSLSIAGYFELDIYVLNLSELDDLRLNQLFEKLPAHCLVLLEDVDAADVRRWEDGMNDTNVRLKESKPEGKVTLSGLLNVLDGVSSKEDRLVIMTTNHLENLDAALIRPGRVDKKIYFKLADGKMTSRLFRFIYKDPRKRSSKYSKVNCNPSNEGTDEFIINQLAKDFAAKVPEDTFSPAEILSFLVEYKNSPADAVILVEEWVSIATKDKQKAL